MNLHNLTSKVWLLIIVAFSLLFEIQSISAKSISSTNNQEFFAPIGRSNVAETFSSSNAVEIICKLPQRDDYIYTGGVGAHKLHTDSRTWNEARKICKEENAHLAVINSKAEESILTDKLNKSANIITGADSVQAAFLGIHDLFGDGDWVLDSGESLYTAGYENWSTGQPDNFNASQNCVAAIVSGGMDDVNCNAVLPFFCELFLSCSPR